MSSRKGRNIRQIDRGLHRRVIDDRNGLIEDQKPALLGAQLLVPTVLVRQQLGQEPDPA